MELLSVQTQNSIELREWRSIVEKKWQHGQALSSKKEIYPSYIAERKISIERLWMHILNVSMKLFWET